MAAPPSQPCATSADLECPHLLGRQQLTQQRRAELSDEERKTVRIALGSRIQRACLFILVMQLPLLASATTEPMVYGKMAGNGFENVATRIYPVQDISERYRATLEVAEQGDVFSPGVVRVYDKQSGAELIQVHSEEMLVETGTESGEVNVDVHERSYGEQAVLIYDDFNFDGIEDLALRDGHFSCYSGPSFQVFLGTPDGFRHSAAFTALAQNYCGMFVYDKNAQQISTSTRSGCCRHRLSTFSVHNGEPVIEAETEIVYSEITGLLSETRSQSVNGRIVYTTQILWEEDDQRQILLDFQLTPSGRRIIVFRQSKGAPVYCVAVDGKNQVELTYPQQESEAFNYDSTQRILSFVRGDAIYRIRGDDQGKPESMAVTIHGQSTKLNLQPDSAKGSLDQAWAAIQESR